MAVTDPGFGYGSVQTKRFAAIVDPLRPNGDLLISGLRPNSALPNLLSDAPCKFSLGIRVGRSFLPMLSKYIEGVCYQGREGLLQ